MENGYDAYRECCAQSSESELSSVSCLVRLVERLFSFCLTGCGAHIWRMRLSLSESRDTWWSQHKQPAQRVVETSDVEQGTGLGFGSDWW
jgi:hypothetical protein